MTGKEKRCSYFFSSSFLTGDSADLFFHPCGVHKLKRKGKEGEKEERKRGLEINDDAVITQRKREKRIPPKKAASFYFILFFKPLFRILYVISERRGDLKAFLSFAGTKVIFKKKRDRKKNVVTLLEAIAISNPFSFVFFLKFIVDVIIFFLKKSSFVLLEDSPVLCWKSTAQ